MAGFDVWTWIELALALAAGGALTGVLAGLFGIGGGALIVPILYELFGLLGTADDVAMPLAVGTSLAIIAPTSLRSAAGHRAKSSLDMGLLRAWAVPIVLGVLTGALIARFAAPWVFQAVFVGVAGCLSAKLLLGRADWRIADAMPGAWLVRTYGALIGLLSALMGIGGGAIATIVMTLHGRAIHSAVGTSAGVGVLIAVPGALGYVAAGWGRAGLPPDALGFVSLLGIVLFVPATLATTQIGVNLAHRLPRRRLEIAFGIFLLAVSARFLWAMLASP
ncbi:sulfite exporter TauE/SafE family protein [soil metagenome]